MFSDRRARSLKPKSKRYEVWGSSNYGLGNLGIRVFPTGKKTWIYMYRWQGKAKRLSLGAFPAVSVAEAHRRYAELLKLMEMGENPSGRLFDGKVVEKKFFKFSDLCHEYMEKWARLKKKSWRWYEKIIEREFCITMLESPRY